MDDEIMAREILESFLVKITSLQLVKSCKSAVEALEVINTNQVDLIFLDINMPEISGLSLAKSIHKNIKIIFTTAYREYAIDGFDLQAVDYLLKPIAFDRFLQAVNKFFEIKTPIDTHKLNDKVLGKKDSFFVKSERKMIKISFDEILYIESLSDYIKIYSKEKCIVTRETISNLEKILPSHQFFRIHRSYIVSKNKIESYTNEFIEVNRKALPISRTYKQNVLVKLESF